MKRGTSKLQVLLVSAAILVSSATLLMAQTTGEYRSNAPTPTGGIWSSAGTWQTWNGSSWVTATSAPTGSEPKITIQSTDSVYVDAAVTITDTLYNQGKLVAGGSNLTIGNGGVYQHAENGGKFPTATWGTGSTCLVTGVTSSAPTNANQNFYNFTWNCPSQSSSVNVGWQTGVNVAGTLTCTSSNWNHASTSSPNYQFRLFGAAGSCTINNIVVDGNKAVLTTMGSGYNDTVTVNGNITLSNGCMLSLSNNSGGIGTYYLNGDLIVVDSAYIGKSSSGNLSKIAFNKAGTQNFTHSTSGVITYFGAPNFLVNTGSTLNLDTVAVGGAGSFTVSSGATVGIGHPNGVKGNIATSGSNGGGNSLSSSANYIFNGSAAQVTSTLLPNAVNNLTINNAAGVTLTKAVNVGGTLAMTSGILALDTNYVIADTVSGGSSTSYMLTDSSKSYLMIPNVASSQFVFPVGTTTEGYSPVWMKNFGTADTFSVSAAVDSSSAAGGGRVNVKWNVSENHPGGANCTLTFGWMGAAENSTFSSARSTYAEIYNLSGSPYKQAGSGAYSSQFTSEPYTLSRGGITNLGSFGVGKFSLSVAPAIGDYGSVLTGNWSSLSTWKQWDGTGWNTTPSVVPSGEVDVFVNSGDTVTVDAPDSVGNNLIVYGYLKDVAGLKTAGATVVFDSASTYELAHDGGKGVGIPTATWNKASLCLITGNAGIVSSTTGFNANQNFYNFTINAAFSSNKDLAWYDNTIGGNLVINNPGNSRVQMTSPGAGTFNTITIKGNVLVTAGQFSTNGSSGSDTITVNSYGNIIATGGNFSISRGSGPIVRWNSYGDSLSFSNDTTQSSSSKALFVFAKQGNQYLKLQGVTFNSGGLPVEVDTGATLVMGTASIGGDGSFTADSGSVVMSGDTTGLNGNIATSGTVKLSPGASVVFNGAIAQTTGSLLSGTIKNLTINNAKGITLSKSVTVAGALTMTSGILYADTNSVTATSASGGSSTSYVSTDSAKGFLAVPNVKFAQAFFPVGTHAEGYSPVWITNAGTADLYSVNAAMDTATVNGGGRVNVKWNIAEGAAGGSKLTLQFGWMTSAENSVFASDRAGNAMIYLLKAPADSEAGSGSYTTQFSTQPYTVSRGGITEVGTFGVGNFTTTGINDVQTVPIEFKLYQNYPNPFNPSTKIEFSVLKKGLATVKVYNILGQEVTTLFSQDAQPGKKYMVEFNAGMLASGVYFSVLQSNGQRQIQKMVLMK